MQFFNILLIIQYRATRLIYDTKNYANSLSLDGSKKIKPWNERKEEKKIFYFRYL